jgi:hypothetical protein
MLATSTFQKRWKRLKNWPRKADNSSYKLQNMKAVLLK